MEDYIVTISFAVFIVVLFGTMIAVIVSHHRDDKKHRA